MNIFKRFKVKAKNILFEEHIDYILAYHGVMAEGFDVSLDFVSEMCEAFVMFDEVFINIKTLYFYILIYKFMHNIGNVWLFFYFHS